MTGPPEHGAGLATTLHEKIRAEIEERIVSGEWPPGHRLPSETDLAHGYGCSRMTMNKVLTQLTHAGLLQRRRRAGTFVRHPVSQSAVLDIKDIRAEVMARGLAYRFEIVASRIRPSRAGDLARFGLTTAVSVLDLVCRHQAGPMPFCLEERLINLNAVPEAANAVFDADAPGSWLMRRVPWTAAEHRIRAVAADATMAAHLQIVIGAACLMIERRTVWAERPVTVVRLTYPGDAHELVAGFLPTSA